MVFCEEMHEARDKQYCMEGVTHSLGCART